MKSYWKDKKVLVTGGAGFIGSHVVDRLITLGAKVTVQVSLSPKSQGKIKNLSQSIKKITLVKANLEDEASCSLLVFEQDVVLNFAGLDGGSVFKKKHTAEIFRTNAKIALNMLEAARVAGVKRFLQVSSTEVYPDTVRQPIKESYGFMKGLDEKIDGYVWSKRFSEIASKMYNTQYGMEISIVRPSNVYGSRDHLDKGRVIATFIQQALQNKPISVWNGGSQKKSFLYISDFVTAVLGVVEKYKKFDPINIAGERYLTIKQLGNTVIRVTKSKSTVQNIKVPGVVSKDRVLSTKKARDLINFKEMVSLEEGLVATSEYITSVLKAR